MISTKTNQGSSLKLANGLRALGLDLASLMMLMHLRKTAMQEDES